VHNIILTGQYLQNECDLRSITERLQVLANGFLVGPHAYLHSSWNVMDGSLVILSLFDVVVTLSASQGQRNSLGILRVFRLLRTLRPLRFVSMLMLHLAKFSIKNTTPKT